MWNISQGYRVRKSRVAVRGDVSACTHYGAVRVAVCGVRAETADGPPLDEASPRACLFSSYRY